MRATLSTLRPNQHGEAALLLHRSLVSWYESRLRQGARFGSDSQPFLLIPQVYEALDPGESIAAQDATGRLVGVCFVHPRETHFAVGIVATDPESAGKGIARLMMEKALERARAERKPLRLVSSLLNLDSFSLYTRLGLIPNTLYQDLSITVPANGQAHSPPAAASRVRLAKPDEAPRLADFEHALHGIRREKDYAFFLNNTVGDWKVWVLESADRRAVEGVLVSSHHPHWGMLGPGCAGDTPSALALLWKALDARRGQTSVFLVPSMEHALVSALYAWGARNVELHVGQSTAPVTPARGITFPTFLPESA